MLAPVSDRDFGGLVREARDRLGMSHSRVADLIGRSPSTVKAWERGRAVPSDANVVSSLAAVLGIDEALLFEAAGMERPGTPARRSLGESLAEIAPAQGTPGTAAAETSTDPRRMEPTDTESSPHAAAVDVRAPAAPSTEDPVLRPRRELRAKTANAPVPPPEPGRAWAPVLNAIDRISSRLRRRPRRHALVATPVAPTAPTAQPSYVEDPEQRLIYRFRSVLLAVGAFALAIVFVWSAGEFLDAVGTSLDALFGSE